MGWEFMALELPVSLTTREAMLRFFVGKILKKRRTNYGLSKMGTV